MKKYNILVFPYGSGIGQELYNALSYEKNINLIGCGNNVINPGKYMYNVIINDVPHYTQTIECINKLNQIIKQHSINFIFPAYDDIIVFLKKNEHKLNAKIITSPLETVILTRSKKLTYESFKEIIPVPITYNKLNCIYPIFAKPNYGQGAIDSQIIQNSKELEIYEQKVNDYILCELLPGKEYTIDCFTDRHGELLFANGRERVNRVAGLSVYTKHVNDSIFNWFAEKINQKLKFRGMWFFQLKYDKNNKLKLLEIAPRVSGAMGLHRNLGINLPLLAIYDQLELPITIPNLQKVNYGMFKVLHNHFNIDLSMYKHIFIDYDDTLIIHNKVNTKLLGIIYREKEKGKKIYLITKHQGNLYESLNNYWINKNLFNKIFHLQKKDNKNNYVLNNSIFIDDSFLERQSINKNNVLILSLSQLELLE